MLLFPTRFRRCYGVDLVNLIQMSFELPSHIVLIGQNPWTRISFTRSTENSKRRFSKTYFETMTRTLANSPWYSERSSFKTSHWRTTSCYQQERRTLKIEIALTITTNIIQLWEISSHQTLGDLFTQKVTHQNERTLVDSKMPSFLGLPLDRRRRRA